MAIAFMGYRPRGVSALPGYSVFIIAWAGHKGNTGVVTRNQSSSALGGGYVSLADAQNNEINWDIWLDAGTYKFAMLHITNSGNCIYTVNLDAASQGTVDGYAAGLNWNVYSEITGIAVTAGLKNFQLKAATKNASSSGYATAFQTLAWIRTGA